MLVPCIFNHGTSYLKFKIHAQMNLYVHDKRQEREKKLSFLSIHLHVTENLLSLELCAHLYVSAFYHTDRQCTKYMYAPLPGFLVFWSLRSTAVT